MQYAENKGEMLRIKNYESKNKYFKEELEDGAEGIIQHIVVETTQMENREERIIWAYRGRNYSIHNIFSAYIFNNNNKPL